MMVNPEKRIVTSYFRSMKVKSEPQVSGVVRMPHLKGFYKFQELAPNKVRVTYQVYSDPGGMLPGWLAARSARKLPYKTLTGLRKRFMKTRGKYEWMKKKYDPAFGGVVPPKFLIGKVPDKTPPATPAPAAKG